MLHWQHFEAREFLVIGDFACSGFNRFWRDSYEIMYALTANTDDAKMPILNGCIRVKKKKEMKIHC